EYEPPNPALNTTPQSAFSKHELETDGTAIRGGDPVQGVLATRKPTRLDGLLGRNASRFEHRM
ncbi:MAG: hypothetical protein RI900_353, partial [Actinomycetota bacterium]